MYLNALLSKAYPNFRNVFVNPLTVYVRFTKYYEFVTLPKGIRVTCTCVCNFVTCIVY